MILVTGGAGFIGSNFILEWLESRLESVVNLDKLTYAGNVENLLSIQGHPKYEFVHGDIADQELVAELLRRVKPRAVINFAAETHVDRSISGPGAFIQTNVVGTSKLLETVNAWYQETKPDFRFFHVSTDEVYGSLGPNDPRFTEMTAYAPNSPYSASKASSDHLVRAYHHTYGLPTLITNCSNNYGPFQYPEKLIPLVITNAIEGKPIPVYGDGLNVRDWLYVRDHCEALRMILNDGRVGDTYNIGGDSEVTNIEVVRSICALLDVYAPAVLGTKPESYSYSDLITYITDRPGHDKRYAIDASKLWRELGWRPSKNFKSGLRQTVGWYLIHRDWVHKVQDKQ